MKRSSILATALIALVAAVAPAAAQAKALRAPALVSPVSNAHVEGTPAISWGRVPGAVTYEYQVAADRGFGSVVKGTGFGQGSSRTGNTAAAMKTTLPDGDYYWRVRAVDAADHAGRWSAARHFVKAWTTAPLLLEPSDASTVQWPALPLVLRWTPVPFATDYVVTIATDTSLSSPILGTTVHPQTTQGTNFALPTALADGQRYYWAITPRDADGHGGQRSRTGSFTWHWSTATTTRLTDQNVNPGVMDPQFSWDPVPGAASYEVDVNYTENFSPAGRVCCTDKTIGTSLSPTNVLPNNDGANGFGYYFRVRAFDAAGNAGQWNHAATTDFKKAFDDLTPSIPNLHVTDSSDTPVAGNQQTDSPIVKWDPVPGASSYEVQVAPSLGGSSCDWTSKVADDDTASTAWTYLSPTPPGQTPGPESWPRAASQDFPGMTPGQSYCVRVLARSDRDAKLNDVISTFTQLAPAFTYQPPASYGSAAIPLTISPADYLAPQSGQLTPATPLLRWKRVAGAKRYFVVIARDSAFTQVVDLAFTENPDYAPRLRTVPHVPLVDETTSYYWVVMPATGVTGSGVSATIAQDSPRPFDKRSFPPQALAPAPGEVVGAQPAFHWTPVDGARRYRLQVSQDPTFAAESLIDDVTTASTGFTSSTTYPADAVVYWRVQALDENLQGQSWSCAAPVAGRCQAGAVAPSFQRLLPVPSVFSGNPVGGVGIPVLQWGPVLGAISYEVHVDWVDGKKSDFTVASTAFTPTAFSGNGIWRWKVRANFPTARVNTVSGGYLPAQDYVRRMARTPSVRATRSASRVLVSWDSDAAASTYRVEVSRSNAFNKLVDRFETKTTSFAPDLSRLGYKTGGTLYWRVASLDDGDNAGAWTTGTFVLPRGMTALVSGLPRKGRRSAIKVTVRGSDRGLIRAARVRVTAKGLRSASRKTNGAGVATFSVKPRHNGKLTFTITRKGYRDATAAIPVS